MSGCVSFTKVGLDQKSGEKLKTSWGDFNPVHHAHLVVADQVRQLGLDQVYSCLNISHTSDIWTPPDGCAWTAIEGDRRIQPLKRPGWSAKFHLTKILTEHQTRCAIIGADSNWIICLIPIVSWLAWFGCGVRPLATKAGTSYPSHLGGCTAPWCLINMVKLGSET